MQILPVHPASRHRQGTKSPAHWQHHRLCSMCKGCLAAALAPLPYMSAHAPGAAAACWRASSWRCSLAMASCATTARCPRPSATLRPSLATAASRASACSHVSRPCSWPGPCCACAVCLPSTGLDAHADMLGSDGGTAFQVGANWPQHDACPLQASQRMCLLMSGERGREREAAPALAESSCRS